METISCTTSLPSFQPLEEPPSNPLQLLATKISHYTSSYFGSYSKTTQVLIVVVSLAVIYTLYAAYTRYRKKNNDSPVIPPSSNSAKGPPSPIPQLNFYNFGTPVAESTPFPAFRGLPQPDFSPAPQLPQPRAALTRSNKQPSSALSGNAAERDSLLRAAAPLAQFKPASTELEAQRAALKSGTPTSFSVPPAAPPAPALSRPAAGRPPLSRTTTPLARSRPASTELEAQRAALKRSTPTGFSSLQAAPKEPSQPQPARPRANSLSGSSAPSPASGLRRTSSYDKLSGIIFTPTKGNLEIVRSMEKGDNTVGNLTNFHAGRITAASPAPSSRPPSRAFSQSDSVVRDS